MAHSHTNHGARLPVRHLARVLWAIQQWQLMADIVAKVVVGHFWRKNGIRIADATNLSCATAPCGESMLRAKSPKILLQQYRHDSALAL
jgi:hypothetical protein